MKEEVSASLLHPFVRRCIGGKVENVEEKQEEKTPELEVILFSFC